jgi:hypothetical protein
MGEWTISQKARRSSQVFPGDPFRPKASSVPGNESSE